MVAVTVAGFREVTHGKSPGVGAQHQENPAGTCTCVCLLPRHPVRDPTQGQRGHVLQSPTGWDRQKVASPSSTPQTVSWSTVSDVVLLRSAP